jgi:hypothetical protein
MSRFFIEVPHASDEIECARVIQTFLKTGSHYLSHAEWGCMDGEHKAWIILDVDSREDALRILPPAFRPTAKIICLTRFTLSDIENILNRKQV